MCGRAVGDRMLVRGEEGRGEGGEGGECRVKALGDRCLGQRKRWERECWGDKHVYSDIQTL